MTQFDVELAPESLKGLIAELEETNSDPTLTVAERFGEACELFYGFACVHLKLNQEQRMKLEMDMAHAGLMKPG